MTLAKFVWANLWRRPMRTVLTFTSVTLAFTLLGLALGLRANLRQMAASARADRIYASSRYGGRLQIAQREQISQLPGVRAVSSVDGISGYVGRPVNRIAVTLWGDDASRVFPELSLSPTQWQALRRMRDGVYVSKLFAAKFSLHTGSVLPVISATTPKADGTTAWTFNVLEIVPDISLLPVGFAVGNFDYLDAARPKSDQGTVRQFWLVTKDATRVDSVIKEIDGGFANSAAPTASVSEKSLIESNSGNGVIATLLAIAASGVVMILIITANALRHSLRERTTELAVLKTLGFSNLKIVVLMVIEATIPCLFGCCVGLIIAGSAQSLLPRVLPTSVILPMPKVDLGVAALAIAAATAIAMASACLPVLKIARLDVAATLARH